MISNGLQKYANYFDFANKLTKKTLFIIDDGYVCFPRPT